MPSTHLPSGDGFDLESAVRAWHVRAAVQGADGDLLVELEDHVREEFAKLVHGGMASEQAWKLAVARLGEPAAIGREIAKLDGLPAIDRAALGVLVGSAALAGVGFLAFIALRGPEVVQRPVLTMHIAAVTLGYLAGLLAAAIAGYATLRRLAAHSALPALSGVALRWIRAVSAAAGALVVSGFMLGAAWANDAWGRPFNGDPREICALLVAALFLAAAATASAGQRAAQVAPAVALLGGGFVLAGWFGAAAHLQNYPAWPTAIGFGGLAGLAFAVLALRVRELPPALD